MSFNEAAKFESNFLTKNFLYKISEDENNEEDDLYYNKDYKVTEKIEEVNDLTKNVGSSLTFSDKTCSTDDGQDPTKKELQFWTDKETKQNNVDFNSDKSNCLDKKNIKKESNPVFTYYSDTGSYLNKIHKSSIDLSNNKNFIEKSKLFFLNFRDKNSHKTYSFDYGNISNNATCNYNGNCCVLNNCVVKNVLINNMYVNSPYYLKGNLKSFKTRQKTTKPFKSREGDWVCLNCRNLNFAFRVICNRCRIPKGKTAQKMSMDFIKEKNSGNNIYNNLTFCKNKSENILSNVL